MNVNSLVECDVIIKSEWNRARTLYIAPYEFWSR